ncbi:MAG: Cof-type HAD-IIB family hydrolase [Clostridia bacterium]|nr:Cof-type HAD-IIB family hydrolase [Clostridia bacterium]
MRNINFKLIVSDFDGTLLTSSDEIPQSVKTAISDYVDCGGIFAVCTGRMLCSILPRVRELGLKGIVVAHQGTVIAEIESGKILKYGGLESVDVAQICKSIEGYGHYINVYSGDDIYTNIPKQDEHLKLYEKIIGVEAQGITDMPLSEYVLKNNLFCQKVASLVSPSNRDTLYNNLVKDLGEKFDVTCSASVLVEVSPRSDNKGEALKFIANYFGIDISSTVAIGDNLNDLSMINAAGVGVAVGNATQELKDAADFVTVTNDEGAVAKIIEKFGYK